MRALPKVPALAAVLAVLGCAGNDARIRGELDVLHAELSALQRENEALSRKVQGLEARVDAVAVKAAAAKPATPAVEPATRAAEPGPARAVAPAPSQPEPLVPPSLAVVKIEPPSRQRARKPPPPVPTAIPLVEPDRAALDRLPASDGRALAAEGVSELRAARALAGLDRAHALEDFWTRHPSHPEADNALVEAAAAYVDAGREGAACEVARRVGDEYPAGDAMSAALERLAWCESRLGSPGAERRILSRLVAEHPETPAAHRAAARLAQLGGEPSK